MPKYRKRYFYVYLFMGWIISIYGLGKTHGKYGLILLGVKRKAKLKEIGMHDLINFDLRLTELNLIVTRVLERHNYINTNNLIENNAYRAIRANLGLPNRGQRTHSNSKTTKTLKGL